MIFFKRSITFLTTMLMLIVSLDITKTSAAENDLGKYILSAMEDYNKSIDISSFNITGEVLVDEMEEIFLDNPQLFYVNDLYTYTCRKGIVSNIKVKYYGNKKDIEDMNSKVGTICNKILEDKPEDSDIYSIIEYVHDYLINNCVYAYEEYENNTIDADGFSVYGTLVEKKAVCLGYSKAFQYILKKIYGIECFIATSDKLNHAWNIVKIKNEYYHIDVTADDTESSNSVSHKYYMMMDSEALEYGYQPDNLVR